VTAAFGIWTTMTFFALVGLLRSLHGMFAQRDRCRPFPAHLEERLPLWQQTRRRGRKVTLAISDSVSGAVMFGLHNPCIALPASLVESLTPDELDLVVLHEHAHAQRRDDWAALVQALLRPALWMHPAAWFVTRSMGFEREAACDEQVVARTGMPKDYARCLARAAEARVRSTSPQLLAPALFSAPSDLARRVDRVLARRTGGRHRASQVLVAVAASVLVLLAAQLRHVPLVGEAIQMALPDVVSPAIAASLSEAEALVSAASVEMFVPLVERDAMRTHVTVPPRGQTAKPLAAAASALATKAAYSDSAGPGPTAAAMTGDGGQPHLEGRVFHGAYHAPKPAPELVPATPWQRVGTAGEKIGQTAQQAGVGVANAFTRASVSLAKKF
jgi:beta-lactamase regulating signal transducer with metallopeptidase domain